MARRDEQGAKKRANGIATREKILDAAEQIAGERGYDGTSISLVSNLAGYPASSIYWHFKDKDDLIAAVIERSFERWNASLREFDDLEDGASLERMLSHQMERVSRALRKSPEFLRLGLMLALERRPEEPTARQMFLKVRSDAYKNGLRMYRNLLPDLGKRELEQLASFSMALTDGLFVAQQVDDETINLVDRYELQAAAILGIIQYYRRR